MCRIKHHFGDLDIDEKIILKWILEDQNVNMVEPLDYIGTRNILYH
jgi:hypothetical protein